MIEKYGLQKDFILLGKRNNPYPYYVQTDLYIHASRFEGKSIAIREAQVLGCAILASDCSGNREQICNGRDGILCPPVPQDLASAVMLLAGSRQLREKYAAASRGKPTGNEENIRMLYELLQ
jgi:glycosyltransferase involved in cell wall biosynthesis